MQTISNGPVQTVHAEQDGKTIIGRFQDCTPIAELCQTLHKEGVHGSSEMRHAGKIPAVMVEKYINDHGITFREFLGNQDHIRRVMNDPAMAYFRIWPGKV
jgi:hypothetical protein